MKTSIINRLFTYRYNVRGVAPLEYILSSGNVNISSTAVCCESTALFLSVPRNILDYIHIILYKCIIMFYIGLLWLTSTSVFLCVLTVRRKRKLCSSGIVSVFLMEQNTKKSKLRRKVHCMFHRIVLYKCSLYSISGTNIWILKMSLFRVH